MKFLVEKSDNITGTIKVSGAKNAALKMIAAAILMKGSIELKNAPRITDVENMLLILKTIGGTYKWVGNKLLLDTTNVNKYKLPIRIAKSLRGSVVYVGALLARFGKAELPFPGGCAIGKRPITAHIDAFRQMGVAVSQKGTSYIFSNRKDPQKTIHLSERSVTATENALLYAVGANYKITLSNVAAEPEIDDLITLLNKAGARIKRLSPQKIFVDKYQKLHAVSHEIIGDRIEAGTWMVAALMCANKLKITGFNPKYLSTPVSLLKNHGGNIKVSSDYIEVKKSHLTGTNFTTDVYPGFPTDLQSPFGLLLTQAHGKSQIYEKLFNDRLKYLSELKSMGASINILSDQKASIDGPAKLFGKVIESTDLRSGVTFVLAGMIADGKTTIEKAEIIDRGYEKVDDKLSAVGANIKRIK